MALPDAITIKITRTLVGIYLIILILLFSYFLITFWPVLKPNEQVWDDTVTLWIAGSFNIVDEIRLLILGHSGGGRR